MRALRLLPMLAATALVGAQDLDKLPSWAVAPARAAAAAQPPAQADAWVLLQKWEMDYRGEGEFRLRNHRLVKVLTERGIKEAEHVLDALGGRASKVKRFKGWNLRPDGELVKLDSDRILNIEDEHERRTGSVLPRAARGSLLAFETDLLLRYPLGPVEVLPILEDIPVAAWEVTVLAPQGVDVRLDGRNLAPWVTGVPAKGARSFACASLPAWPEGERGAPHAYDVQPMLIATVLDPAQKGAPVMASWDALARWEWQQFSTRLAGTHVADPVPPGTPERLRAALGWIQREVRYEDVYLSPERGWVPEYAPEVVRKHYGDCKDQACLMVGEARAGGFQAFPVLARIQEGRIEADPPVYPYAFNHVIAAIRLEKSFGFPAEVTAPSGRYLLVDPTDRYTPLGRLNPGHRGRRLLICTESGGEWVQVPDGAPLTRDVRVELDGKVDAQGALTADVHLREEANAFGLRATLAEQGEEIFARALRTRLLELPPNGALAVLATTEPQDLASPFQADLHITVPGALTFAGGEAALAALGFPQPPPALQPGNKPRKLPVEGRPAARFEYHARLEVPWRLTPVTPLREVATAFRKGAWKASCEPGGAGGVLDVQYVEDSRTARYGYDALERGAAEWKLDRAAASALREDGFAFKLP